MGARAPRPQHRAARAHYALKHFTIKHFLHSVRGEERDFATTRRAALRGVI
jgi:hypothetical protein